MARGDERTEAVVREYSALADVYDERWSRYVEASTRETLRRLGPLGHGRVLDVACGTGVLLAELSSGSPAARLVGLDAAQPMLRVARERLGARAQLVHGRAEELPFADGSFDLVLTANAFHFLADPRRALLEMRRVLRPAGGLVVTDWCDDYLACRVCDRLLRFVSPSHRRIYGSRRCRSLLLESGFDSVSVERYKISWIWGLMTGKGLRSGDFEACDTNVPLPAS